MGKASRPFPVGQFRLYNTKRVSADKPRPIQIQFSVNSVAVRRNTGYSAMEADWNPAENKGRGGVKASYGRDYRLVNARLMDMAKKTEEALAAYCEFNGHRLTSGVIRDIMDGKAVARKDKGQDFADYTVSLLRAEHERNNAITDYPLPDRWMTYTISDELYDSVLGKDELKELLKRMVLRDHPEYSPRYLFIDMLDVEYVCDDVFE